MTLAISPNPAPHPVEELSKSPEVIAGMFNRIAKTYDVLNDCMTGGMHRQWKAQACKALQLKPGGRVLDVCTGTGDLAAMLSGLVGETGQVEGIDFSEEMLAVAQKRFAQVGNIKWCQGDALALPYEDNRFDGAIISFGLRNVMDIEKALAEMVRVVRPGGWVVNLDTASDCKNPLFWLYFSKIMPLLGRVLAGDTQAYQYLCRSSKTFATPSQIQQLLHHLGLQNTAVRYFGLGSVSFQAGQKRG